MFTVRLQPAPRALRYAFTLRRVGAAALKRCTRHRRWVGTASGNPTGGFPRGPDPTRASGLPAQRHARGQAGLQRPVGGPRTYHSEKNVDGCSCTLRYAVCRFTPGSTHALPTRATIGSPLHTATLRCCILRGVLLLLHP